MINGHLLFEGSEPKTSQASCVQDVGKDRPGSDMNDGNSNLVDSADDCCCQCMETDGCQAWAFSTSNNGCWLKNSVPDQTSKETVISGIVSGR